MGWARFATKKAREFGRSRSDEARDPGGLRRDPEAVLAFYDLRRRNLRGAKPNAAHFARARLEDLLAKGGEILTLVTQNIDDLHERGAQRPSSTCMAGFEARCGRCEAVRSWLDDLTVANICPNCGRAGALRPHVVWFGEMPLDMDLIDRALREADLFVAIETLGAVYPAAGFVAEARAYGLRTCEINLEAADNARLFDEQRMGPASERFRLGSRSSSEARQNRTNLPAHLAGSTVGCARVGAFLWVTTCLTWSSSPEIARKKYLGRTT